MSGRNSLDPTRGAAIMRHALERVIRPEVRETVRRVDRATAGGEKVRVERSVGYVDEQRLVLTPTIAAAGGGVGTVGDPRAPVIVTKASPSFFAVSATSFTAYVNTSNTITLESGVEYTVVVLGAHSSQGMIEGRAFFGTTVGTILSNWGDSRTPFSVSVVVDGVVGTGTAQTFGVQVRKTGTTDPSFGYGTVTCIAIPAAMAIGGGGGGLAALRVESDTNPITTPSPTAALDFGAGFLLSAEDAAGIDTHTDEVNVALNFGTGANQVARGDHTHNLDALSDVTVSSPATNHVLTWNGTNWTNQALAAPVLLASPRSGTYYTFPGLVAGYGASTMTTNPDPATTYYFPIFVPRSGTLNGLGVIRQDTTAGNVAVKLALFAMDPTSYAWSTPPIREGAVTTTSGNPIAQYVTVTNYAITRGWYWVGIKVASALGLRSDDVALIAPNSVSYPWMDRTAGLRHVGTAYATPWAASSGTGTWQDTHDAYRVLLRITT